MGRDAELAELVRVLDRLGEAQLIEIHGEPGIGKTCLLNEFARLARQRGHAPILGYATEYERNVPFGAFAEIFARIDRGAAADAQTRAALSVVLPAAESAPLPGTTGLERYRLHRTLRQALTAAARSPGLMLLLDDLHWADEASLELLEHLLDDPDAAVVVAVAYRTGQAPPRLAGTLARTRLATTRIELNRLRAADVAGMLPGVAPHRVAALVAASGGNPLYLDALGRLDDRTLMTLADPARTGAEQIPAGLQSLVAQEFASLDAEQRLAAHALAVTGEPAHLDVVAHVSGLGEAQVSARIDELVAVGIVRPSGTGFSFRHPLIRAAAYQSAGPAWRIGAHRLAETYLSRRGGPLAMRAHHCARAAGYGDIGAVDTLVAAATSTMDAAPAIAAEWLRVALRILPSADDTAGRRGNLLLALAKALQLCGELAASRGMLHEMLGLPTCPRGPAVRLLAITERLLGRFDEAQARLEAELARSRPVTDRDGGAQLAVLASVHLLRNNLEQCEQNVTELLDAARRLDDENLLAVGQTLMAIVALNRGDPRGARRRLAAAVPLVDAFPDAQLREHLHLLAVLAWLELNLELYADGRRHLERGIAIARSGGLSHALPYLFVMTSTLEERIGRLDTARQYAADAAEMSRLIGSAETLAMARGLELRSTLWQRGPVPALALAERLMGDGRATSEWNAESSDVFIATVQLAAGQPAACIEHLEQRAGGLLTGPVSLNTAQAGASLALARARLGGYDEARDLAVRALAAAVRLGLPFHIGLAGHAQAQVLAECGRPEEAITAARAAVRSFRDAGTPVYEALARETLAEALAATGDLALARVELGAAKSAFAAAAARWLTARATRAETKLGARTARGRRPLVPGVLSALSVREGEVAALAGGGLTNREIAQRLHLSPKTVDAHLGRVFGKLGVRSRVELATLLSTQVPATAARPYRDSNS